MSSTCQNIKTEYESLKNLKEAFALAWATAKETGDFSSVKQLKKELEKAQDVLEEKLFVPWAKPVIPNGMTLESHKEGIRFPDPSQIELHLEPEQLSGEKIRGTELMKRLADKQRLNASVGDFLFAHQELIPESWKKKDVNSNTRYINFVDTTYRDSFGDLCVRCLYWSGSQWGWNYGYLRSGWSERNCVAIPAS